jgi:DNA-binding protein Fis
MKRRTWNDRKDLAIKNLLREILATHKGIKAHASRDLCIDRGHLQRLLKRYGLVKDGEKTA